MRFIEVRVLCEGHTEVRFITQALAPYLKPLNVFATPEALCRRSYGIVPYDRMRAAIKTDLGRSRSHQFVTTMIDLYQIGKYPGAQKVPGESVMDRVNRIESQMAEGLPNPRFIPYVQVHEFEALVFVGLDRLVNQFPDGEADGAAERLMAEIGSISPEEIDDGEQTAPSKRLIREVPAYHSLKSVAGPLITAEIGVPNLRDACPHFNEWVSKLEKLSDDE